MVLSDDPRRLNHPMTRDQEGDGVIADGGADRTRSLVIAHPAGNILVGGQSPQWDPEQRLPNFQLEIRSPEMEFDLTQPAPIPGEDIERVLLNEVGHLPEPRVWKTRTQVGECGRLPVRCGLIDEGHMTDPFCRRRHQQSPEGALRETVPDLEFRAAIAEFPRRHTFDADEKIMQPACPG